MILAGIVQEIAASDVSADARRDYDLAELARLAAAPNLARLCKPRHVTPLENVPELQ